MSSFVISYDLVADKDYSKLYESSSSSSEIRDNLKSYVDADDKLFVARLTGEAAWRNVLCTDKWLKDNL